MNRTAVVTIFLRSFSNKLLNIIYIYICSKPFSMPYIRYTGPRQLSQYSNQPRAGWSRDRIPVWARFSAPVQTGPVAHPASYTMGTASFLRLKQLKRGVHHLPHLTPRLKSRAIPLLPLWACIACSKVKFIHRISYQQWSDPHSLTMMTILISSKVY